MTRLRAFKVIFTAIFKGTSCGRDAELALVLLSPGASRPVRSARDAVGPSCEQASSGSYAGEHTCSRLFRRYGAVSLRQEMLAVRDLVVEAGEAGLVAEAGESGPL